MMKIQSPRFRDVLTGVMGAVLLSESAFALSCARPDLLRSLDAAKASPKTYHILVGRFTPKTISPPRIPKQLRDHQLTRTTEVTQSSFEGVSLAQDSRYDEALSGYPVDIEISCTGPWCARAPGSKQELIAFVEARPGQAPILRLSPCSSQTFSAASEQVEKVRQCLTQSCPPDKPNWAITR